MANDTLPPLDDFERQRLENLAYFDENYASFCERYRGLFVGIAFRQLICVEHSYDEADATVSRQAPRALHRLIIRVGDILDLYDNYVGNRIPPVAFPLTSQENDDEPRRRQKDEPGDGCLPPSAPDDRQRQENCPKQLVVRADADHEYWFDMIICGEKVRMQIDTGCTNAGCHGAVSVTKTFWDRIKAKAANRQPARAQGIGGVRYTGEKGECKIKIDGLCDKEVTKFVSCTWERKETHTVDVDLPKSKKVDGNTTVETDGRTITVTKEVDGDFLVGTCFFHEFGGRVTWEPDKKQMTFDAPGS